MTIPEEFSGPGNTGQADRKIGFKFFVYTFSRSDVCEQKNNY